LTHGILRATARHSRCLNSWNLMRSTRSAVVHDAYFCRATASGWRFRAATSRGLTANSNTGEEIASEAAGQYRPAIDRMRFGTMLHIIVTQQKIHQPGIRFVLILGLMKVVGIFHVFASLAEFERNLIRERTMAGLRAARSRGRNGGRPRKLRTKDIQAIKALMTAGELPVQDIADRFGVSRSTLYRNAAVAHRAIAPKPARTPLT
jgi:hypothetical protein